MSADAGYQSEKEVSAAFETYLEVTEDEFRTDASDSDDSETPDADDNSAEDQENDDLDADEADDDDALGADDDAEETPEDDADDAGGSDEGFVDSIETLAEHFGVEADQVLQGLMVDDVDGEPISVGEALDSWRESEGTIATRSQELETQFTQRREAHETEINRQVMSLQGLTKGMIGMLTRDFSPDRMAELRTESPEHYADAVDRKNEIEQMIRGSLSAADSIADQRHSQSSEEVEKVIDREEKLLLRQHPEWRDKKVRVQAMKRHGVYLKNVRKFSDDEIAAITDHRILGLVEDAVLGRAVRQGSDGKKLKNLKRRGLRSPSTGLRVSSRREPVNTRNKARKESMARLKRTGRAEDSVALFMDHIED